MDNGSPNLALLATGLSTTVLFGNPVHLETAVVRFGPTDNNTYLRIHPTTPIQPVEGIFEFSIGPMIQTNKRR